MKVLPNVGATDRARDQAINELIQGRSNATGSVTLTASTTTTTVSRATISKDAYVFLQPQTAHASAEMGNGTIYWAVSATGGSFTITHANNAQTDRTFGYLVIGG